MTRHAIYLCLGLLAVGACGHSAEVSSRQPARESTPAQSAAAMVAPRHGEKVTGKVAPPAYRDVTIPAGTELVVALETPVGSATSDPGDAVRASLVDALVVDNTLVIPANAAVTGQVVTAHASGRVKGRASVAMRFDQVVVGDRQYAIDAALVNREAAPTKKKDALSIGVPAAAGSIIGAIAGGKKGAVVGGAVGGGAGTAYVLSTAGKEIVLPAGAHVRARLTQPLTVRVPLPDRADGSD